MSLAIVHTGADDDAVVADTVCRGRSIHRKVPARILRDKIGQAVGHRSIIKTWDRESRRIVSHHPAGRIYRARRAFTRACGKWDGNHSALIRPDEWRTRALVLHARTDYVTGVTHSERKRAI